MLVKNITFTDFNGIERTEEFRFNISKSELAEMEFSVDGGLENFIKKITQKIDAPEIMAMFKKIILMAYGEKSDDGRRFIKSEELSIAFSQTPAYDELFIELMSDSEKAANFINEVLPDIPKNTDS